MPSPRREDNVETQDRTNASQIINNSSADPELAEHMKSYDFLTRETAYRLWGVACELQKRPTATLVNTSITSCRCQLHDLTEEMVCLQILLADRADLCSRLGAVSAVCNSTLSVKAIWMLTTTNPHNTSATSVCLVAWWIEPLLQDSANWHWSGESWICYCPKKLIAQWI